MDKKLWQIIEKEIKRQEETLDLIPSENFVDLETLFIVGSPLMNKYAEGYPGKRYYPGNKFIDEIENLAKERALKVFKLNPNEWAVNVQPYSGSPANLAVYLALAEPGETIMGLNLFHGGHLTHGHKVSYTGKLFKSVQYGVNPQTETIDYEELEKLVLEYKPKIIISGTTAYPRTIDFKRIGEIAKKVGAYHVADTSHIAGLVIANLHPSPFSFADIVTMTTHKTLRGPRGAVIFMRKELEEKINKSVFPGLQGGPHMQTIAGIAYAFGRALKKDFFNYQKQIVKNAKFLAEELKKRGFKLYTDGTDNHLMIVDLKPLTQTSLGCMQTKAYSKQNYNKLTQKLDKNSNSTQSIGKIAETLLERANIIANRNSLPSDTSPFNPTGIRLGTPAVTSRGMKEKEMKLIAEFFERILIKKEKPERIKKEVIKLVKNFPLPYRKWLIRLHLLPSSRFFYH
ncbi:MAG: serine hydroxymethyltransferase [Candidatus Parcubacteria bacterium]|nr:MAG: serine hydroxymethyltransferase [Candidatus Parcubacteria bacterium]